MTDNRVSCKLATIVDEYQLAFNAGTDNHVSEGDIVDLYRVVEVKDPESQETLGSVSLVKIRLRVGHVQKRLCVARVIDRISTGESEPMFPTLSKKPLKKVTAQAGRGVKQGDNEVSVTVGEDASIRPPSATERK